METVRKFTSADLALLPDDDGNRYEIIEGDLYVTKLPRREGDALKPAATLHADDALESPTLPGFSCQVSKLFFTRPTS